MQLKNQISLPEDGEEGDVKFPGYSFLTESLGLASSGKIRGFVLLSSEERRYPWKLYRVTLMKIADGTNIEIEGNFIGTIGDEWRLW